MELATVTYSKAEYIETVRANKIWYMYSMLCLK